MIFLCFFVYRLGFGIKLLAFFCAFCKIHLLINHNIMNRFTYWFVALLLIVAGVVGVIVFVGGEDSSGGDGFEINVTDEDWTKWAEESNVFLIEYSDFQCPACMARLPMLEDLEAEFGDYVTFVYRHLPLESIHPSAKRTAMAAEAAGLQGEFWAMHDLLFEKQGEWSSLGAADLEEVLFEYAQELELDTEKFQEDLDSKVVEDAVEEDMETAAAFGLGGTPTFFLNDRLLSSDEAGYDSLKTLLAEEIRSQR